MCYWEGEKPVAVHEVAEASALRAFKLLRVNGGMLVNSFVGLASPMMAAQWKEGRLVLSRPQALHGERGIYCLRSAKHARDHVAWCGAMMYGRDLVLVELAVWGRLVEYGGASARPVRYPGYRAQCAKVVAVEVPRGVSWRFEGPENLAKGIRAKLPGVKVRLERSDAQRPLW